MTTSSSAPLHNVPEQLFHNQFLRHPGELKKLDIPFEGYCGRSGTIDIASDIKRITTYQETISDTDAAS
jgi:hypothetical protein